MRLPDFKVEQWMNVYEGQAVYNLTDTCAKALTVQELLDLEPMDLNHIRLDYGEITGDRELKKRIVELYKTGSIDTVTTCHGCLEANDLVMNTLLEPGDEVIICQPSYQQFEDIPKSLGCIVHKVELDESNHWLPKLEDFKKYLGPKTKMIILNNPNNPTGTLLDEAYLTALAALCRPFGTYIFCDEVYRGFSDEPSISDLYENGISTSSLSKVYALAGLRFGWIKANTDVIHAINVRRDYTMISTGPWIDALADLALRHREELVQRNVELIHKNKAAVRSWLETESRYSVELPASGTVAFMKYHFDLPSETLAKQLLADTGVFFVPGSCFDHEYHVRLGLAQDPKILKQGLSVLSDWTNRHVG
ncbi:MAG: aminotransferase class I/II-fold pyridoxal phosphate-dependent enzyme [Catenisphaera adipataccumulans]|jgi:aspartate/methionine/tyrosine aminotransferase|uniref:aminotransferase class I/II-fold pyridoxal phosphate-dependent enzyme n=1 Tax=Catenisphaera adipataccumulans TaxID=700500 RepID=UPI003D9414DB